MKRIAIIASSVHSIRQGHLIDWVKTLRSKVKNVAFFVRWAKSAPPGAKVFRLESRFQRFLYFLRNTLGFRRVPAKLLMLSPLVDYAPTLIHLLTAQTYAHLRQIFDNSEIRLVVSFRGYDLNVFPYESEGNLALVQEIFRRADRLHFISNDLLRQGTLLGADPKKSIVIHRSFDTSGITKEGVIKRDASDRIVIVTVGRLVWEKGYVYGLEALSVVRSKGYDFSYYIIGEGPDRSMLVFHIKRLGLEENVHLVGELEKNRVFDYLAKATIYLQPSISEGLCNAVMEASFHGLPIVAFAAGGIPEVVVHNETGLLCDTCDYGSLANNIQQLIDSPGLRDKLGRGGNLHILNNFSRDKEINEWIRLYNGI